MNESSIPWETVRRGTPADEVTGVPDDCIDWACFVDDDHTHSATIYKPDTGDPDCDFYVLLSEDGVDLKVERAKGKADAFQTVYDYTQSV